MLIRRAITVLAILRTNPVPILSNLPRNPSSPRKSPNHVAHQLRLPNAPRMPSHHNQPPTRLIYHQFTVKANVGLGFSLAASWHDCSVQDSLSTTGHHSSLPTSQSAPPTPATAHTKHTPL